MKRFFILFFFIVFFSNISYANYEFQKLVNLKDPWGSTFVDENNLIITEKNGSIKLFNIKSKKITSLEHDLDILEHGQGGLLDILYYNNYIYVSYSENRGNWKTSTSIAKSKFNNQYLNFKNIFQANPPIDSGYHFGSRLAIKDEYLFASAGERGKGMIAQDPSKHPGSIIIIYLDGGIPEDNHKYEGKSNCCLKFTKSV